METVNNLQATQLFKASTDKEMTGNNLVPLSKNGLPLAYVLKKGMMILLYEKSPEELKECTKAELVKRLYKVTGLATTVISNNTYGVIDLTFHEEARPSTEVKGKNGAFKAGEELREKVVMLHTQIRALVEGKDFEMSETGELKLKD